MTSGSIDFGTPKTSRMSSRHSSVSRSRKRVREAFVTSVTCTPPSTPPVRFQSTQRVGRAEEEVAGLGLLAGALDVLEDPDDLRAGEVGAEGQADDVLEALDAAVGRESVDDLLRAGVLPDDRVVDGLAGVLVPDHRGLALVGDADGLDVVAGDVGPRRVPGRSPRGCSPRSPWGCARPSRPAGRSARARAGRSRRSSPSGRRRWRAGRGRALVDGEDVVVAHGWCSFVVDGCCRGDGEWPRRRERVPVTSAHGPCCSR